MKPSRGSPADPNGIDHDHSICVSGAIDEAEAVCRQRGLRLTAIRRRVLEIIWQGHEPVKAYDILDALNRSGRRAAPPTVYRALDFLLDAGLIHRLASLNAFIGCAQSPGEHEAQMLICRQCDSVTEIDEPGVRRSLHQEAAKHGFHVTSQTVEIQGLCARCRQP
jgi:Fur family zinc uptake transcriptional regulator